MIRREPTTPGHDFAHRMAVGLIGAGIIAVCVPFWHLVQEARAYRDFYKQTPFRDVEVLSVSATALKITLTGTLIKQRDCQAVGGTIAQVVVGGVALPATFEAFDPPGTPASRAVSPAPQAWGPWVITSPVPWPDEARMFRTHRCGDDEQTNMVFSVEWPKEEE